MKVPHAILMLCHGVNCGLKHICKRFTGYCPNRDQQTIEHCDEEMRNGFVRKD